MAQLEKAKCDLKSKERSHEQAILGAKLVAETERLALKSELDVRVDLLSKEVQILQDERKKLKTMHRQAVHEKEVEIGQLIREVQEH